MLPELVGKQYEAETLVRVSATEKSSIKFIHLQRQQSAETKDQVIDELRSKKSRTIYRFQVINK